MKFSESISRLSTAVTRPQGVVCLRHPPAPCRLGGLGVRARHLFRSPFTARLEPQTYVILMQCDNHPDAMAARARARIASGNFHDFMVTLQLRRAAAVPRLKRRCRTAALHTALTHF